MSRNTESSSTRRPLPEPSPVTISRFWGLGFEDDARRATATARSFASVFVFFALSSRRSREGDGAARTASSSSRSRIARAMPSSAPVHTSTLPSARPSTTSPHHVSSAVIPGGGVYVHSTGTWPACSASVVPGGPSSSKTHAPLDASRARVVASSPAVRSAGLARRVSGRARARPPADASFTAAAAAATRRRREPQATHGLFVPDQPRHAVVSVSVSVSVELDRPRRDVCARRRRDPACGVVHRRARHRRRHGRARARAQTPPGRELERARRPVGEADHDNSRADGDRGWASVRIVRMEPDALAARDVVRGALPSAPPATHSPEASQCAKHTHASPGLTAPHARLEARRQIERRRPPVRPRHQARAARRAATPATRASVCLSVCLSKCARAAAARAAVRFAAAQGRRRRRTGRWPTASARGSPPRTRRASRGKARRFAVSRSRAEARPPAGNDDGHPARKNARRLPARSATRRTSSRSGASPARGASSCTSPPRRAPPGTPRAGARDGRTPRGARPRARRTRPHRARGRRGRVVLISRNVVGRSNRRSGVFGRALLHPTVAVAGPVDATRLRIARGWYHACLLVNPRRVLRVFAAVAVGRVRETRRVVVVFHGRKSICFRTLARVSLPAPQPRQRRREDVRQRAEGARETHRARRPGGRRARGGTQASPTCGPPRFVFAPGLSLFVTRTRRSARIFRVTAD